MEQLDRTMQQVVEAEQDIYEDLVDTDIEELQKINTGEHADSLFDKLTFMEGQSFLENYEIVKRAAEQKGDSDIVAAEKSLRSLMQARARVMATKAAIQQAVLDKVAEEETGACRQELAEYEGLARQYGIAAGTDSEATGDDIYSKQLQDIMDGDYRKLMEDIDACSQAQAERSQIYAELESSDSRVDTFREDILKHLAGSIVVKEHKIRY